MGPVQRDVTMCDLCGREWHQGDPSGEWLSIEIVRGDATTDTDWINADFCSQEHASEWLKQPLPPMEPMVVEPTTWKDRLMSGFLLLLLLWALALMLLGSYAFVRLLGGWD